MNYALFSGDRYYPVGGWQDFRGLYRTVEDAIAAVPGNADWWHVVDLATLQVARSGSRD